MRKILAVLLLLTQFAFSAELRYFMQSENSPKFSMPYGDNGGKYAQSGDAKIYYEIYGKGEVVVVLHGGGLGSMYEMGGFIDELKQNYQVIAISTRAHGKSDIGQTPFSLEQRADDIMAVLKHAKVEKAVNLLGFSDGGYSAYAFGAKYQKMAKKLVTIGAGEVLATNKRFVFKLDEWRAYDAKFITQQEALMSEPKRYAKFLKMYEDMWNGAVVSKEIFSKISAHVLVINGQNDMNSHLQTAVNAYQSLPNASLAIIPDTSHPCFLENFDAVWAVVKPFLAK
ncbi:alpha/beta hydrolase [Campylobacter sp. RM13119]|uniref:alpha/beta fold hydrolase n=1 Tax=Campylobacter californiensis TaxID=1032243 RepID=UPI00147398EF|nr:alpha/beta hydrolase [Campylobacter sp. RM13119]MBE3606688.1 alpha/beta hydrolase [Campylobacter sp. RM13119]